MKKIPDGQLSFDDILNPDYVDPKEEKTKRRKKTKEIMEEIEEKTGLIRRFEQFRGHLDAIRSAAEDIRTLNYRQYEDSRLTELADKITAEVSALKE